MILEKVEKASKILTFLLHQTHSCRLSLVGFSPPTPRHHKDVPILNHTTDPNSTLYPKPYSYPMPAHLDGYRWDTLKSGLHVQDPVYRPRSLSDADDVKYPYLLDKHYPHHYGAGSSQHGEDDKEMDDYHDGKAIAVDGSLGVNTLDVLGRKHICPTCFRRFNRPSSLRIHLNTHTGATCKYPLWVSFLAILLIHVWFSLAFECPWPNCGREFNVNSNISDIIEIISALLAVKQCRHRHSWPTTFGWIPMKYLPSSTP